MGGGTEACNSGGSYFDSKVADRSTAATAIVSTTEFPSSGGRVADFATVAKAAAAAAPVVSNQTPTAAAIATVNRVQA
jgi:hypothetical protein